MEMKGVSAVFLLILGQLFIIFSPSLQEMLQRESLLHNHPFAVVVYPQEGTMVMPIQAGVASHVLQRAVGIDHGGVSIFSVRLWLARSRLRTGMIVVGID